MGHYMDDRQDKILTAGTYELADDYHARILGKVYNYKYNVLSIIHCTCSST